MTRSLPPIQFVFDSHGHLIGAKDSQVDSYGGFSNMDDEAQNVFKNFNDGVSSTMKWATIASIVSGVVVMVAIVAIVYAIIDCLRKAGTAIPTYARLATADTDKASNPHSSSQDIEKAETPLFPVLRDSQVEHATMERFLSNMAREKPIRFSPKQLAEFTENYSTILGSGGFGVVFKGQFPNGMQVAVKVLNGELNKRVEEQFMAEVSTMGRTYHINLVRLYGFCFDPMMRALVYECMENGSLDNFLFRENSQEMLEWEKLYDIAVGTAKGIAYLHEECQQRIIHYDIKPGNVLLDKNLNPKVADFGLAKLCNRGSSHLLLTNGRGTPGYAAPELWKPYPVTHKCDVYSFGMLLFEIVGRRRNFDENQTESRQWLPRWTWDMFDNSELAVMMSLCGIEEKDKEKAERVIMVALWCVQYSPDDRPLMSTVVKMLEGSMEITPPPFPFEHMVSPNPTMNLDNGSNGGSYTTSISSSSANTLEQSNSKPVHRTFEIELAT
ncbi:rust resistance kinase Lr10 [Quercus suber]|uniref:rust resistance kinase Lr10 n=1 Tax=Quercus suber TaxID=58331 RepID=UPI000CE1C196|nr:rust resistance kinase Lr10-like isoform X1 [Quercus suber]